MSMVHPPPNHQVFPAQGKYARPATPSNSNATATVPPPLAGPSSSTLAMPPPTFIHRHTSPFPESQTISFSALGPAEVLSNPPPAAPRTVSTALPDVPAVATDKHVPAAFPPTPDLSSPDHQVLYPDAMIKLAPPADDVDPALEKMKEIAVVEDGIARLPLNSLDYLVGDQVPTHRTRSKSQQLLGVPSAIDPVAAARGKSASPRPKPPKRSHTANPSHSFRSSTPPGPDVRIRLHSNISGLPRSKFSPLGPNSTSSSMHRSYTSESVKPRYLSAPIEHSASDFGPADGVEAKIVFLGDADTGKTSLILRYIKKRFIADPTATLQGQLYISKIIAHGVKVKLQIWDTAGQEKFGPMTALYYRKSHVCVLVYDISNRQSFFDLKDMLNELLDRVPDAAMYIVGHMSDKEAMRAVYPAEARAVIRLWRRPPVPITTTTLTPPSKKGGMFRSLSSASKHAEEAPKSINTARSHSFDGLSSMDPDGDKRTRPIVPPPQITLASPVTSRYPYSPSPASGTASVPFPRSTTPTHRPTSSTVPTSILRSPTSPTMVTFPPYVAPSTPTSAMTTEHASLISFPPYQMGKGATGPYYTSEFGQRDFQTTPASAAKAAVGRHGASAGRFSISGYLGWGRAAPEESAGAVSSLARLAEDNPTSRYDDHRRTSDSYARHSADPSYTTFGSSMMGSSRFDSRRKSEQWTSRIGWGGAEPSPSSDQLGEFGEGVKKKLSGEMLSGPLASLPHRATRSRGGSLGRDSRLHDDVEPALDWGVDIEGIRLGECSALTGEGVEEMFRSISTLLAAKKDRLEKEQILRKKNSVVLTAPAEPDEVQGQGYTCCAI